MFESSSYCSIDEAWKEPLKIMDYNSRWQNPGVQKEVLSQATSNPLPNDAPLFNRRPYNKCPESNKRRPRRAPGDTVPNPCYMTLDDCDHCPYCHKSLKEEEQDNYEYFESTPVQQPSYVPPSYNKSVEMSNMIMLFMLGIIIVLLMEQRKKN